MKRERHPKLQSHTKRRLTKIRKRKNPARRNQRKIAKRQKRERALRSVFHRRPKSKLREKQSPERIGGRESLVQTPVLVEKTRGRSPGHLREREETPLDRRNTPEVGVGKERRGIRVTAEGEAEEADEARA